jgi:hypothetical protein
MLNSRDINLLQPNVAENCKKLIELAALEGWKVLVTGTVRDDEYQLKCYNEGHSNAKIPSFHSVKAGLAFDICQNIKGHEYDNNNFWKAVSRIGKQMGFTWGGDWKSIVDKPHFQWDEYGKYTSSMIRSGKYPDPMPLYNEVKDEEEMTGEEIYKKLTEYLATLPCPEWAEEEYQKAIEDGITDGTYPMQFTPRYQAAIMDSRTLKKSKGE